MTTWMYRIKRFLAERETFISVVILGITIMFADILTDLEHKTAAARTRMVAIGILLALFVADHVLRSFRSAFPVPLMLTEDSDRQSRRARFVNFLAVTALAKPAKIIESTTTIREEDLIVFYDVLNLRASQDIRLWQRAWIQLVEGWSDVLDRSLANTPFVSEGRCYHIFPHVVLPMSFAIGAAVNLRRRVVLYHSQGEKFHKAIDLTHPRKLFSGACDAVPLPKLLPDGVSTALAHKRLILYLFVSSRHQPLFHLHADHNKADNAALFYAFDLGLDEDWLPYVQNLVASARSLVDKYEEVSLCLSCPSVVAFALGMAFSRTPKITVCHWSHNQYVPVFSLSHIERKLPFD